MRLQLAFMAHIMDSDCQLVTMILNQLQMSNDVNDNDGSTSLPSLYSILSLQTQTHELEVEDEL